MTNRTSTTIGDPSERPHWRIGAVVEWMQCPVIVLSDPKWDDNDRAWQSAAAYLAKNEADRPLEYTLGQVVPHFNMCGKEAWDVPLTDEQEALAMRVLLSGS